MFDRGKLANMGAPKAGPNAKKPPALCMKKNSPCVPDLPIRHQRCLRHRTGRVLDRGYDIPDEVAISCNLVKGLMEDCKDCPQLNGDYESHYAAFTGGCMDQLNAYWTASNYGEAGRAAIPAEQGCKIHTEDQLRAAEKRKAAELAAAKLEAQRAAKAKAEKLAREAAEKRAAAEKAAEWAAAKKKAEEEKAKEHEEAVAAAKEKAKEAAYKKKLHDEAVAKHEEELAAAKAAAKKKAEEAAAKKKAHDEAVAEKAKAEEAAAKKAAAEKAAREKKAAAEALAKKEEELAAAAAETKKKEEEAAAKKKAHDEAVAKKKAAEEAAKKKAVEFAAAKKAADKPFPECDWKEHKHKRAGGVLVEYVPEDQIESALKQAVGYGCRAISCNAWINQPHGQCEIRTCEQAGSLTIFQWLPATDKYGPYSKPAPGGCKEVPLHTDEKWMTFVATDGCFNHRYDVTRAN